MDSEPQEKGRGIILQCMGVLSAVSNLTLSEDVEAGPGNRETEAPELTRKSLSDRISLRNKPPALQDRRLDRKQEQNL